MPTLWKLDPSPPACAVRTLGDILGIEFDYEDVNFSALEHKSPEFLKMNPLGTIPVLKDGDFFLTDSHAIQKYLLKKYGSEEQQETLYPSDLQTRAIVDQAQFFDAAVFFIKVKLIALPALFGSDTELSHKVVDEIESAYSVVEAYLGGKKYIAGDHFTLADLSVGVTAASIQPFLKIDKTKYPQTAAWLGKLYQIPAFKKYCGPGFEILGQIVMGAWERNKQK